MQIKMTNCDMGELNPTTLELPSELERTHSLHDFHACVVLTRVGQRIYVIGICLAVQMIYNQLSDPGFSSRPPDEM